MLLYLLRHGRAEQHHPDGDEARRLTSDGTKFIRDAADGLRWRKVAVDRIIASPYVRAIETATIVAEGTGHGGSILTDERLIPSGPFEGMSDLIREYSDMPSLLLVGHQPLIGEAASMIVSGGHLSLAVSPGTLIAIQIAGFRPYANGELLWSVPQEFMGLGM